ncbi:hypothetical protein SPRG_04247 [Saprolegnia parasitica CBS 223.65]|uniref:Uncharacterized protein n=1 Tax=Saprolegnia parasitica (strain CBS 223.65) TaxID=695850 RepID=A0A067CKQ5_SAPPC|nr:hypothetical protein SPRG_04247 [Saprolegnia parasitica CBS 223.65]KDO31108.1 hypothetical protein SPRG_04247 [Saprolegnia parasitica CBS 223.65]|eukprot:XP_012198237.1 hypothetical protein SPRG_04247 [Saprolegnia parasitica CBS 223.65]
MAVGADDVARGQQLLSTTLDNRVADVAYLLRAGVSPHWQSWQNATPLFLAAMLCHTAIAQLLVRANADIDETPLASIPPTAFLSLTHEGRESLRADSTASARCDGPTPLFVAVQNAVDVDEERNAETLVHTACDLQKYVRVRSVASGATRTL